MTKIIEKLTYKVEDKYGNIVDVCAKIEKKAVIIVGTQAI